MRRIWMDNLRAGTVALVFVYHVFYLFNASGVFGGVGAFADVQYQDALLYFVYPWFMILLFSLAGMSARYSLEKRSHKAFLASRTGKLLVPSTLGLFAFQWLVGYLNMANGGGLDFIPGTGLARGVVLYLIAVVSGTGPLWFAQLLWLYSLLLVLLRKLDRKDRLWTLAGRANGAAILLCGLLLWAGAQVLNAPLITVYRFGVYFTAFLLGYYLLSHEGVQAKLEGLRWPLLLAAVGMNAGFTALYWGQNYADYAILKNFFTNACAWMGTLAAIGCGRAWLNRETEISRWLVGKSWGIYVCHYLPLLSSAIWLNKCALPPAVVYLLTTCLGALGTLCLYEILRRVPGIRFLVLGEKSSHT